MKPMSSPEATDRVVSPPPAAAAKSEGGAVANSDAAAKSEGGTVANSDAAAQAVAPAASTTRTQRWRAALSAGRVTHLLGVPDSSTAELFGEPVTAMGNGSLVGRRPLVITVCREGEAFAMAAGLWAGGARPAVWMQSTGLFGSGDSIRSVGQELRVPVPLVVGWRGRLGKPNAGQFDTATEWLEPTLLAWRIPYVVAATADGVELGPWLSEFAWEEPGIRAFVVPQ